MRIIAEITPPRAKRLEVDILRHPKIAPLIARTKLSPYEAEQLVDDLQETGELKGDLDDDDVTALATALQRLGAGASR
tara:strand:- start:4013 stop:4246 length:234 start_codon:yes stop_codon:yes gene_type:complete